jgi:16S rRNA C967 or C1407 C5-methylase (RsmB/RsmF family)
VLRRENDAQVAAFCAAGTVAEAAEPTGTAALRGCQTLPGDADGDGFYYASLLKPDTLPTASVSISQQ